MAYKSEFKIPPELYHYTTLETLLNIVQNQDKDENSFLRLTNFNYLNDRNEFKEFTYHLEGLHKGVSLESLRERGRTVNLYVFSLSAESDLLSQWRGYSNKDTGICIGFNPDYFQSLAENNDGYFEKVQYSPDEFHKMSANHFELYKNSSEDIMMSELFKIMLFYKNQAWSEEKEWRLVLPPPNNKERKCMIKNGCIAPYIEVPIPFGERVITSIRIQHRNDKSEVKQSILKFMNEWGFPITKIDVSSIPIQ